MVALRLRGGGAGASTPAEMSPQTVHDAEHAGIQLLAALDDRLVAALESGAIKLVRAEAVCRDRGGGGRAGAASRRRRRFRTYAAV